MRNPRTCDHYMSPHDDGWKCAYCGTTETDATKRGEIPHVRAQNGVFIIDLGPPKPLIWQERIDTD